MVEAKRRLAAILAADVAGYSRLMGDDERATMDTLNAYREVFRRHIAEHDGRVVDTAGDSVLAVFDSVVEAAQCAVEVQGELEGRNTGLPEERQMLFRIGVNLGDVFEQDDGTIYGDGVNLAARLESLAEPGGLTISGTTFDHVDGKLDTAFEYLGEKQVKNIAKPVRVYRADLGAGETLPQPSAAEPERPSIAVLAFDNLSGDPEQEYFADGISEDIITDISKVSGLFVIARNSAFSYKGKAPKIDTVCRELGVRYVLEGSVRKAGGRVRITAQLIDGTTGGHVWAERYDRDLDDIFAVQDDVTRNIVAALKVTLTPTEQNRLVHRGTSNIDAYDAFARGRDFVSKISRSGLEKAVPWLKRAIALDPDFAAPRASLALVRIMEYVNKWGDDWQGGLDAGYRLACEAIDVDDLAPHARHAQGTACLWLGDLDRAIAAEERAIALDPNFAPAYLMLAMALHYAGDSRTALRHLQTAMRLDPTDPDDSLHQVALCQFMLRDFDAAEATLKKRIAVRPSTDISRALLVAALGHQGRIEEARALWAQLMDVNPHYSFAEKRKILPYRNTHDLEHIADGLRAAGIEI